MILIVFRIKAFFENSITTIITNMVVVRVRHNGTSVVILERTRHDLARRGTVIVNQHHKRDVGEPTTTRTILLLLVAHLIFGIDHQFALGQELVGHTDSLVEVATRVATHIEDKFFHPLLLEFGYRFEELLVCSAGKACEPYVSHPWANHKGRINTVERNLIPHNIDTHKALYIAPFESQAHLRATLTTQTLHNLVLCNFAPCHRVAINSHNPIAGEHSRLIARATGSGIEHHNGVGCHISA